MSSEQARNFYGLGIDGILGWHAAGSERFAGCICAAVVLGQWGVWLFGYSVGRNEVDCYRFEVGVAASCAGFGWHFLVCLSGVRVVHNNSADVVHGCVIAGDGDDDCSATNFSLSTKARGLDAG